MISRKLQIQSKCIVKTIPNEDLEKALKIDKEYLGDKKFLYYQKKFPSLFCGCYVSSLQEELIGIVYGYRTDKSVKNEENVVLLSGIAVVSKCWRKGYGRKMINFFQKQVSKLECPESKKKEEWNWKISLGAARGYVEKFYISCGYHITSHRVKSPKKKLKRKKRQLVKKGYKLDDYLKREDDESVRIYIPTNIHDTFLQKKLQKDFETDDVIFIFEKDIPTSK